MRAVASADDEDVETTGTTGEPLDLSPSKTTTPGGTWKPGPQAIPKAAQAYAGGGNAQPPFPGASKSTARVASLERDEPPKAVSGARVVPTAWVIQLGAMDDEGKARSMLSEARAKVGGSLSKAAPYTVKVEHGGTTLFRARFSGFAEQDSAQEACSALKRSGFSCFATRS